MLKDINLKKSTLKYRGQLAPLGESHMWLPDKLESCRYIGPQQDSIKRFLDRFHTVNVLGRGYSVREVGIHLKEEIGDSRDDHLTLSRMYTRNIQEE